MIVIKFGGTSVGDAVALKQAIEIVAAARERKPIVVVSALSGVTNQLVEATQMAARGEAKKVEEIVRSVRERHEEIGFNLIGQKSDYFDAFLAQLHRQTAQISDILRGLTLVGEVSPRAKDKVVAIGEKLSSVLFAYTTRLKTLSGVHVDSEEVIVTDERFGEANPLMAETRAAATSSLLPEIANNHIPVMGGFIGRSAGGATTTLGRGGSDYSAAIVGAAVGAEEIQIWTDVDGMMTCDPRLIPAARIIERISYVEAAELAYFGAKVLHPKTIAPAVEQRIPIRVLNTHNPDSRGTLITLEGDQSARGPRAIALKKGITVMNITASQMLGTHGFLAKIFEVFNRLEISVDLIATSEVSVSVTVEGSEKIARATEALSSFGQVDTDEKSAIVAVVGSGVISSSAVGEAVFRAITGLPVVMLTMGKSGLNLSIVLPESHADQAVRAIHKELFERSSEEAA